MDLDFELLMTNIRAQVHEYIDNVLVKCCKEYNLPFNEVRQKVGLSIDKETCVEEKESDPKPVKKPTRKASAVEKPMCTALTRNGDPCKSKATDNETYCKKHLVSMQKKENTPVLEKKRKTPSSSKKTVVQKPVEVTVNDLPKDEAEWLVNEEPTIGTIAPDLSMTNSFYPTDVLYNEDDIVDDVSESESQYVLDE